MKWVSLFVCSIHCVLVASTLVDNTVDKEGPGLVKRQGRDFSNYYTPEEDKKEYHSLAYPPSTYSYQPVRDAPPAAECPPNPMIPLLNNGMNLLLLKLGVVGIVKVISAVLLLGFLIKVPILLAKFAFLKAFLLPILIAPMLLLYSHTQGMMPMRPPATDKPTDGVDTAADMGRSLELVSDTLWRSVRMVTSSDRCLEKIACSIGTYSNDTDTTSTVSRMAKYLQYAAPPSTQARIRSLREAFQAGSDSGSCLYTCTSPHVMVRQGSSIWPLI